MTSHWRRRMGVAWLLLLSACVGTPVTEPPSVSPPELPQVNARETLPEFQGAAADSFTPIGLAGGPGAVEPNALVWAINLDGVDPPVVARADADGSFEVPVAAMDGDQLRMHVLVDGEASAPLDMIFNSDLVLASPEHPTCATATPTMVDFGTIDADDSSSLDVLIENTCAETIDISLTALHQSTTDFALRGSAATLLGDGESVTLTITFQPRPTANALRSTVLLVDVQSATDTGRIAVTLWGRVR